MLAAAALGAGAWNAPALAAECLTGANLPTLATPPAPGPADPASQSALGRTTEGRGRRMVAPVLVSGQGPFPFVVDTGANRTALSRVLAQRLGIAPIGTGEVHSVYGVASAPIVAPQNLVYGPLALASDNMPLIEGEVLGGEAGLLGVDSMRDRRLRMDFDAHCIEITPSRTPFLHRDWNVVRAQLRFGNLVVIRGHVRNRTINVLIDTGSDSTLANPALRTLLGSGVTEAPIAPSSAYGATERALLRSVIRIPSLRMGDVQVSSVIAFVGDFHIFHVWGLDSEPTLLLGMDALTQTRALMIDFGYSTVYFQLRPTDISHMPGAEFTMNGNVRRLRRYVP